MKKRLSLIDINAPFLFFLSDGVRVIHFEDALHFSANGALKSARSCKEEHSR